jgi:hypothetical protein
MLAFKLVKVQIAIVALATKMAAASTEGMTLAQSIAKIATLGWAAAMDVAKVALVGLGIGAVIILIVLLVTHWKLVKRVAVDALHWIEQAAKTAFGWLKKNWPLVLGILGGPFVLAVVEIVKHWGAI